MEIPNRVIIKAHQDWGAWYRAEANPICFDTWLKRRWGVELDNYKYHKPKGYYPANMVDKGKAALFMLKYYD